MVTHLPKSIPPNPAASLNSVDCIVQCRTVQIVNLAFYSCLPQPAKCPEGIAVIGFDTEVECNTVRLRHRPRDLSPRVGVPLGPMCDFGHRVFPLKPIPLWPRSLRDHFFVCRMLIDDTCFLSHRLQHDEFFASGTNSGPTCVGGSPEGGRAPNSAFFPPPAPIF